MGLWAKSLRIFHALCDNTQQSMRQVAQDTGLSKSSVPRLTQAMERRDGDPESWWWETAEGHGWLLRLVVAPLYIVGLKRGVGAESISEFFCRLRLASHIGCSPSALRGVMDAVAQAMLKTTAAWEQDGIAHGETRPIIGAVDKPFLARMMLVFMDLVSGSLVCEEVAEERSDDTWHTIVKARLETLGVRGFSLVSDRAKALIKLAETGLECLSIPDLLHLLPDLVKSDALAICSRLRQAQQALQQAQERLATCQASSPNSPELLRVQALVETSAPRCRAGTACTAPIVTTWRPSRSSCIRGVFWTPPARGHQRSNASCQLQSQPLQGCSKPMGCLSRRQLWTKSASSSLACPLW